jgi:hypothetical protein
MRKEIIIVDKAKGVYRVTTNDQRFYLKEVIDETTGLPTFKWKKSVTWISSFYPKGKQFWMWLASKGWSEAEEIKSAAGSKGTKVHAAASVIMAGGTVKMEDKFTDTNTGAPEELTVDEYECLMSFVNWANEVKPEIILNEEVVESEKYDYAGTVDIVAKIGDQIYIIDLKTGQAIWPEYELQISAYKQALKEMGRKVENVKLAFLQLGYKRNKKKFKFTEVNDKFELFLHAQAICNNETENQSPKQAEYPLELKLDLPKKPPVASQDAPSEAKEVKKVVSPKKLTKNK